MNREKLLKWVRYNPETGTFDWKVFPSRHSPKRGTEAGSVNNKNGKHPRWILWIDGERIGRARAAFIYMHGDIPNGALIDHVDGNTLNDRIKNLRLANEAQNTWNRLQRKGVGLAIGVSHDARGRFKARIQSPDGRKINLGTWASEGEAHAAYMGAAAILHSEFWIGCRQSLPISLPTPCESLGKEKLSA